jgi:hypothetical protein
MIDDPADGTVTHLKWALKHSDLCAECLVPAAGAGQIRVLRWARKHLKQFKNASYQLEMRRAAMRNRKKDVILWLARHDEKLDWDSYAVTAMDIDDRLFRWILRTQPTTARVTYVVVRQDRSDLIPWLEKHSLFFRDEIVCVALLLHQNFVRFRWAQANGFPVGRESILMTISENLVEMFKELSAPFLATDASLLPAAIAANSRSAIVTYLLSVSNLAIDSRSQEEALKARDLNLLLNLRKHGLPITPELLESAAKRHLWFELESLISLRDCAIPVAVTDAAAVSQQLDLVLMIAKLGGPLTPSCLTLAIRVGTVEQVTELFEKYQCPVDTSVFMAASLSDQTIRQFLFANMMSMQKRARIVAQ